MEGNHPVDWRLVLAAPYAPTPEDIIPDALRLASLKKNEILYDLGCGDARVLIIASRAFGAKAIGFEIQHELAQEARAKIQGQGLDNDHAKVLEKDFFDEDLRDADVVFIYLTPTVLKPLGEKLRSELSERARVVAYRYPIQTWTAQGELVHPNGCSSYLYADTVVRRQ
jgi:SAM-dependent methyltransferase